jgi:hypothetical protein
MKCGGLDLGLNRLCNDSASNGIEGAEVVLGWNPMQLGPRWKSVGVYVYRILAESTWTVVSLRPAGQRTRSVPNAM